MSKDAEGNPPPETPGDAPSLSRLTPRELDVLALLAQGWRTDAIAAELGIGVSTVKTHLLQIYRKLEVSNRVEAATRYVRAKERRRGDS